MKRMRRSKRGAWGNVKFHFTPKHGSWLNMAAIELSVPVRQCLDRRLPHLGTVAREVRAWQHQPRFTFVELPEANPDDKLINLSNVGKGLGSVTGLIRLRQTLLPPSPAPPEKRVAPPQLVRQTSDRGRRPYVTGRDETARAV